MRKFSLLKSIFSFIIPLLIVTSLLLTPYSANAMPDEVAVALLPSGASHPKAFTNPEITYALEAIPQIPVIKAEAALVIDSEKGQILYSKQHEKRLRSSVANKIMTALIAIETTPLDVKITISKESSTNQENTISLETGGKYSVEDLLYALMLVSSNQASNVLADHVSGSVLKFTEVMNKKALDLGMRNTHFTNASGEYDEAQYTTAQDISILIRYALKNSYFRNYFFSIKARPWLTEYSSDILVNHNRLFWIYDGVNGGTHGYFDPAFQSAVTSAQNGIQTLITIVLNSHEDNIFNESIQLFDYGFANFKRDLLVTNGQSLKAINIEGKTVSLLSMENNYYTFPIGDDYIKSLEFIDKEIKLPIRKDFSLCTARYTLKDDTIIDIPLYPNIEISAPANLKTVMIKKLTTYRDILILLVVLVLLEFIIILHNIYRIIRKSFINRKNLKR